MERGEIEPPRPEEQFRPQEPPRETILVKRGLIYYIGQLIVFPFKLVHLGFSVILGYLNIYFSWIKESSLVNKKRKRLNRYMNMTKDDEVI